MPAFRPERVKSIERKRIPMIIRVELNAETEARLVVEARAQACLWKR
jgi:hypothetical protein